MKIAIDVSQVVYGTGVSVYIENLVGNILNINKANEYILFAGCLRRKKDLDVFFNSLKKKSAFQKRVFPISPTLADIIWNRLHVLNIESLIGGVDIFHSSDWTQPPSKAYKVTTIHDLYPIKFPAFCNQKIVDVHKRRLDWVKKEVDRVIVPSVATFSDLVEMGFKKEKISLIPEAVDENFKPQPVRKINKVLKNYKIDRKYLLSIGFSRKKNSPKILEAFQKHFEKKGYLLVVTGSYPSNLFYSKNLRFLGHVPREDLPALYSGAQALVYPSLYEGFGLPVLEAYACKCPVVTSNTSSLPEVGRGASILVEPKSIDAIISGIEKAFRDRKKLVRKGIKKLKRFSWRKNAEMTLGVYNEAIARIKR